MKNKLLENIDKNQLEDYIRNNEFIVKTFFKNNIIHFEGEVCTTFEIILSGKVIVERIDDLGNLMVVSEFYKDDILGGSLLFSNNPYYSMNVTAKSEVKLLVIKKETLFNLLKSNHSFLESYLMHISNNASILGNTIKSYVNRTIRDCITSYLLNESNIQNSKKVVLNISKKELAEKFGIQRTSLSRELNKMKKDGLIDYDSKSITILK